MLFAMEGRVMSEEQRREKRLSDVAGVILMPVWATGVLFIAFIYGLSRVNDRNGGAA
jgi:hypothetical protein